MTDLAAPVSGAALLGQNDLMGSMLDHVAALDSNADFANVLSTIRTTASRGALKVGLENVALSTEVGRNLNGSNSSSLLSNALAALEVSNLFNQPHYHKRSNPNAFGHAETVSVVNSSVKDPLTGAAEGAALVGAEDIKINFQPSSSTVPTGYTKDVGEAYNDTRGYGWVQAGTNAPLDITLHARDRDRTGIEPRLNTLLHMQYSNTTSAAWEYALPNGQYNVTIGVGDQSNARGLYDSQHTINVEDVTAINRFQGSATQEYKQATVQANVSDGKLTIDAIGGTNTKINYVDIASIASPGSGFTQINWSTVAPSPIGRAEAMGATVNDKLYVFGGFTDTTYTPTRRSDVYDPDSNIWTRIKDLPKGLTNAGMAVDEVNNDVYLAGGYTEQADGTGQVFGTKNVWKYDTDTNTWTAMPSLPQARGAGELSLLDGKLHFFGGTNIKRVDQSSHWVLSLNAGTAWSSAASLPEPRNQLADAVLDGKLYAIGGQRGQDGAAVTQTSVYRWNPITSAWTDVADLPQARSHIGGATFVMDGRILVAGGKTNQANVSAVTAYNPLSDSWTELTPLPVARKSGVAGRIGNQIFYTTGNGFKSTTYKGIPAN